KSRSAKTASKTPQTIVCHFGETRAFLDAILFITNIPESAEVIKKIRIIAIVKKLIVSVKGKYSKKRNISASGSVASRLSVPLAILLSNQIALFPITDIQIKLNKVGIIKTAPTNSRI